jgi:transcriptional regulator with XRE-family HTH domain
LQVREQIFANGRTLTEAARLIGCGTSTLGNYVNGGTKAGKGLIKKLAKFLKCDESDIPKKLPPEKTPDALREQRSAVPDLSWMLADYAELTVIEKMHKQLLDVALPLEERMRRAGIFWGELERRVKSASGTGARGAGRTAAVIEAHLASAKKPKLEVLK